MRARRIHRCIERVRNVCNVCHSQRNQWKFLSSEPAAGPNGPMKSQTRRMSHPPPLVLFLSNTRRARASRLPSVICASPLAATWMVDSHNTTLAAPRPAIRQLCYCLPQPALKSISRLPMTVNAAKTARCAGTPGRLTGRTATYGHLIARRTFRIYRGWGEEIHVNKRFLFLSGAYGSPAGDGRCRVIGWEGI